MEKFLKFLVKILCGICKVNVTTTFYFLLKLPGVLTVLISTTEINIFLRDLFWLIFSFEYPFLYHPSFS
jgi:hypothetical protein